jgi:hypothetical protein
MNSFGLTYHSSLGTDFKGHVDFVARSVETNQSNRSLPALESSWPPFTSLVAKTYNIGNWRAKNPVKIWLSHRHPPILR